MTDTAPTQHLTTNQQRALDAIRAMRRRHGCASAAMVAETTGWSRTYVVSLLTPMRDAGLVTWSADIIGSLRIPGDEPDLRSLTLDLWIALGGSAEEFQRRTEELTPAMLWSELLETVAERSLAEVATPPVPAARKAKAS